VKTSAIAAFATLALALSRGSLQAAEIRVPSGTIHTIQQGVDAAAPGDTVLVRPGTYVINDQGEYSTAVDIGSDKPGLKLKADGAPGSVKIVGPGDMQCISIEAERALVEGFDISGFWKGIVAGASVAPGARITGNTIHDLRSLPNSANTAISPGPLHEVDHNTIYGCMNGIFLGAWPATGPNWPAHIHHNRVEGNGDPDSLGIMLWQAPGCKLDHNECDNNGIGIYLADSPNCTADHNRADNNVSTGILLDSDGSPDCVVVNNEANDNGSCGIGVGVGESCGTRFENNVAKGNGQDDLAVLWGPVTTSCYTCVNNHADTAYPSLAFWDVVTPPEP
jgi:parallel beta-helix repeat protein